MTLDDLLARQSIDPRQVLVLRHRPVEPQLRKVLPGLAAERPEVFNAYQQTQGEKLENAMQSGPTHVASFSGHAAGKALFVGWYLIGASTPLTREEYWQVPAYRELNALGSRGFAEESPRPTVLWFDLALSDFYAQWKGKLVVGWPPPERSWWRRAHKNEIPISAILEESAFDAAMPSWDQLVVGWEELAVIRWKAPLAH